MNHHATLRHAECGASAAAIAPVRRGLTLIELLVTIVIMVTVLAGALPLLSPNNNSRKIREASRQLTTLLAQAQAQAARDGRPVGVAFRESRVGNSLSGMAVEAYLIAEPPAFTGFSEHSRVLVGLDPVGATYGPPKPGNENGNDGELFVDRLNGKPIFNLQFSLYGQEDLLPPRMIRIGDVVSVQGNEFIVVDDGDHTDLPNKLEGETAYLESTFEVRTVWLNDNGQLMSPGLKSYSIRRLPVNSSDQPLQFPRGIGIDLEASGASGMNVPSSLDNVGETTIGIMFSPNGSIESLYSSSSIGTRKLNGVNQLYLLLGLSENGNGSGLERTDYDFGNNPAADAADLAARRTRVNWLHPDSRWVTINRSGRIITADNNVSYDPGSNVFLDPIRSADDFLAAQRDKQIGTARESASNMKASTGR